MFVEKIYKKFERIISGVLLCVGMLLVIFQTIELFWETAMSLTMHIPKFGFEYRQGQARDVVILFFNVLLALEILETVRVFEKHHEVKIRVILLVCLIAISRKILMGATHTAYEDIGTASLLLALSLGYFLITRSATKESIAQDEEAEKIDD